MTRSISEIKSELREARRLWAHAETALNAAWIATKPARDAAYMAKNRVDALNAELRQAKEAQR